MMKIQVMAFWVMMVHSDVLGISMF